MECKCLRVFFSSLDSPILIETYWNVNQVSPSFTSFLFSILIETYWNVNYIAYEIISIFKNNINRDILECKLVHHPCFLSIDCILIETYWNVNIRRQWHIYPSPDINRDILECKYVCDQVFFLHGFHINRDILECK